MDDITRILNRCQELNAVLIPEEENFKVSAPVPLPADLLAELRQHKSDIIACLTKKTKLSIVSETSQWHADTIAASVQREGVCIFWSDLFGERIAFIRDDEFRNSIPCDIVTYTDKELRELFSDGKPRLQARDLKLIHDAKKAGGHIINHVTKEEDRK